MSLQTISSIHSQEKLVGQWRAIINLEERDGQAEEGRRVRSVKKTV